MKFYDPGLGLGCKWHDKFSWIQQNHKESLWCCQGFSHTFQTKSKIARIT